ncbi:unnamed protein product [Brassicogethes aeneus]|uniref:Integrin alpha second immunoglobulin-like domain-containing protein n=1 Tax=Brassicogethes aeneus TaxID=1431903 RepID=A0A9P0FE06_BRAAE|nr:unnamed protein product [Brassicogethes aeneus]
MFRSILFLGFLIFAIFCDENFNLDNVLKIPSDEGSYFGYSLFLQNMGYKNRLIVGAPLSNKFVFECDPLGLNAKCSKEELLDDSVIKFNKAANTTNFFGSVIDGEVHGSTVVTCAPRHVASSFHTRGICVVYNTIGGKQYLTFEDDRAILSQHGKSYYAGAFSQAGFSLNYMKGEDLLVGMPGFDNNLGKIRILNLNTFSTYERKNHLSPLENSDFYLGYSISSGYFANGERWYIAGQPRGNFLNGQVVIFRDNIINYLKSDEFGSYFGASLLVDDVTNDQLDDLFVGAPSSSMENNYDQGHVSFYKFDLVNNFFYAPIKLYGDGKSGSKFGTTMAKLGDIDLDGYNDIAIAAPFEDNSGAVYIFKGSKEGPKKSQKLTPKLFKAFNTRGFGLGLSNGLDIDNNGHNDFAIGAFKSGEVFVIRSKSAIDLKASLDVDITTIHEQTKSLTATYCFMYSQRTARAPVKNISLVATLSVDYRAGTNTSFQRYILIPTQNDTKCFKTLLNINLRYNTDLSPFKLSLKADVKTPNLIISKNYEILEKFIPLSDNCGDDNVCKSLLSIDVESNLQEIILGKDNILETNILVKSSKEPALKCEIIIEKSQSIELRNVKECSQTHKDIVCPVSNAFVGEKKLTVRFDLKNIQPSLKYININFKVRTLSGALPDSLLKYPLNIPIKLVNSPYLQGKSDPEDIELGEEINSISFTQVYTVVNSGPSPMKVDVKIFSPVIENIISITRTRIATKDEATECIIGRKDIAANLKMEDKSLATFKVPENKSISLNCFEGTCTEITCNQGYLFVSELTEISISYEVDVKALESKFKTEFLTKEVIMFLSTAKIQNITSHSATLIYGKTNKSLPIWIYIVAVLVGIILLTVLIFVLYKCKFFNRRYQEKLKEEKLLEDENPANSNVVMSDLEDN